MSSASLKAGSGSSLPSAFLVLAAMSSTFRLTANSPKKTSSGSSTPKALQLARRALEVRVKGEAKDISVKYLDPPHTTAFGIMFLPSEGLYAEVIRIPGIVDDLQRTYKVVVSGPTTLAAILNSLQMGFRTLAIQKRSEEVWKVLSAVRTEFGRFGEELDTAQKRIGLVARSFDEVSKRTRMMDRKLSSVEMMEGDKAAVMLQDSV